MLYLYSSILIIGLGAVAWLFFQESKKGTPESQKLKIPPQDNKIPNLLDRLGLNQEPAVLHEPPKIKITPEVRLPEPLTSSVQAVSISEGTIMGDIELEAKYSELKTKYEKLESLFTEKSEALEKGEKALANEIKNRKDFNKVKDLLEKELKEAKDKNHKTQLELSSTQNEIENHKRRVHQLEEKIKSLEKEIREKEKQIDDLVKRLQTFASPTPPPKPLAVEPPEEPSLKALAPAPEESLPEEKPDVPVPTQSEPKLSEELSKPVPAFESQPTTPEPTQNIPEENIPKTPDQIQNLETPDQPPTLANEPAQEVIAEKPKEEDSTQSPENPA